MIRSTIDIDFIALFQIHKEITHEKIYYSYDYAGNLTELKNTGKSNALLSKYTSTYRLNGQKMSEREERVTKAKEREISNAQYIYDRLGRLRTESDTGEDTVTYSYDSHGNRNEMVQGDWVTAYRYDKNEELLRTDTLNKKTSKDTVALYKYDRNGNELAVVHRKKTDAKGPVFDLNVTVGQNQLNPNAVYHYNAENQLTSALMGKNKVLYTYDAFGYRTSKTVNGKTTNFIWDGDQIVMELNEKAKVKKRYFHGDSLICSDSGEGTKQTYYVSNSHGDVVQLLNQEGTVMREYSYDAFGNEVNPDKKDDNPFRYVGEYYDKETASMYLRARYYTPATGRFMSRDTYTGEAEDPLSLHLYAYCDNDGVNQVDPSGHWGRTNGKYVHQEMTKAAYKSGKYKKDKYFKELLKGCILPDFLQAGKKKKTYKELNKKRYRAFSSKKLLGIRLWAKKGGSGKKGKKETRESIQNTFHGKSKVRLTNLKERVETAIRNPEHKEQKLDKYLLIGCVLHSIQDYSAHSYVYDLEDFKVRNASGSPYLNLPMEVRIYHKDWDIYMRKKDALKYGEEGKKLSPKELEYLDEERDTNHRKTKDNPKMNYTYVASNPYSNFGFSLSWHWEKVDSVEKNDRYVDARKKSIEYLAQIMKFVK